MYRLHCLLNCHTLLHHFQHRGVVLYIQLAFGSADIEYGSWVGKTSGGIIAVVKEQRPKIRKITTIIL